LFSLSQNRFWRTDDLLATPPAPVIFPGPFLHHFLGLYPPPM